jgi:hypothetical protein
MYFAGANAMIAILGDFDTFSAKNWRFLYTIKRLG